MSTKKDKASYLCTQAISNTNIVSSLHPLAMLNVCRLSAELMQNVLVFREFVKEMHAGLSRIKNATVVEESISKSYCTTLVELPKQWSLQKSGTFYFHCR